MTDAVCAAAIVIMVCGALAYFTEMYLREWVVLTVFALMVLFGAISLGAL